MNSNGNRYAVKNFNWRDGTTTWPHHEMWRQWLSEVEADRLAQRKARDEKTNLQPCRN
jgi:hypothetical protein